MELCGAAHGTTLSIPGTHTATHSHTQPRHSARQTHLGSRVRPLFALGRDVLTLALQHTRFNGPRTPHTIMRVSKQLPVHTTANNTNNHRTHTTTTHLELVFQLRILGIVGTGSRHSQLRLFAVSLCIILCRSGNGIKLLDSSAALLLRDWR